MAAGPAPHGAERWAFAFGLAFALGLAGPLVVPLSMPFSGAFAAGPALAEGRGGLPDACRTTADEEIAEARAEPGEPHVWRSASGELLRQAELVTVAGAAPATGKTGARLRFVALGEGTDRWERRSGHLLLEPGARWLARELVRTGQAIVGPRLAGRDCLDHLLREERTARRRKVGLWRHERVWSAHDPDALLAERNGRYTLVAGRVASVGETRSMIYLNFGGRWSRDFTATIRAERKAAFAAAGLDLASLGGAAIRLRGMMRQSGGPSIDLEHPAQIERLDRNGDRR